MEDTDLSTTNLLFEVNQIICLEDRDTCLYGEVIQLIPSRGLCWFRPICMTKSNSQQERDSGIKQLIYLRSGSDLLWPMSLFRPALDTEVVSWLVDLDDTNKSTEQQASSRQYLHQFVQQVWETNQDKF